ncbi:MAG TPA: hypothetical protein DHN33_12045 [Eubacteriaceae bacterium]|nr:hypothetical protein [Eubacteriaceae bacterium]
MRITLQQVENVRDHFDCDYLEAEKALRKSKGDIEGALLYLKKRESSRLAKLKTNIVSFIEALVEYRLYIKRDDSLVFDVPAFFAAAILLFFRVPFVFLFFLLITGFVFDYRFFIDKIVRDEDGKEKFFSERQKQSEPPKKSSDSTDSKKSMPNKNETTLKNNEGVRGKSSQPAEEGYSEITIK